MKTSKVLSIISMLAIFSFVFAPSQVLGASLKIDITSYGKGCRGAGSKPPVLKAKVVPGKPQVLVVQIDCIKWWPNVYFAGWFLLVGNRKASIPVLRPGCTLLTIPIIVFAYDRRTTEVKFPIPDIPALVGQRIYLQGIAKYVGFYMGMDLTQGLEISFK